MGTALSVKGQLYLSVSVGTPYRDAMDVVVLRSLVLFSSSSRLYQISSFHPRRVNQARASASPFSSSLPADTYKTIFNILKMINL